MNIRSLLIAVPLITFFVSGCTKEPQVQYIQKFEEDAVEKNLPTKEYIFKNTPIIGTQSSEDKIIVDMGVVLRIWINSYKNKAGDLISGHDLHIWAKKPDFIAGTSLPIKNRGLMTPHRKMPFMLSDDSVDRNNFKDDENIKKFVNSVYKVNKSRTVPIEKDVEVSKFDKTIKDFIKNMKTIEKNKQIIEESDQLKNKTKGNINEEQL